MSLPPTILTPLELARCEVDPMLIHCENAHRIVETIRYWRERAIAAESGAAS